MFTLRVLDLVAVVLFCSRRQVSRAAKAVLVGGCACLVWYQNPVPCTCIRLPLVRCEPALPWRAMVRSDLRSLASQQEIHRMDHGHYSADPRALGFIASDGVEVRIEATRDGWSATATHAKLAESCRIAAGDGRGGEGPDGAVTCGE